MRSARYARGFQQFSRNRLFEGVGPDIFKEIGPQLDVLQLRRNQIIFREGDPGDSLYLVGRGSVRISKRSFSGEPQTVGFIEKGNFFGGTALLEKAPRSTTAVAAETSVLATVKEETFQQILELAPSRLHINFLRSLNERMRRVNTYFVRETLRAERLRVVDAISNSILRDLKNPVCIARCCSDLIASETSDTRLHELNNILGSAVAGLLGATQDLLDYSRGCIEVEQQEIGVGRLLEELGQRSFCQLRGRNIELIEHIRYDGNFEADLPRLIRVLNSVIQNACDAMGEGGTLTLTADRVHDEMALRISDTGNGIPPELLSKVFKPFGIRTGSRCSGLGLAVAKAVIEAHGGRISIDSVHGKGTTVDIRLPIFALNDPMVA